MNAETSPPPRTRSLGQSLARTSAEARAGVFATLTMDAAMVAAGRIGGSSFVSDRLSIGLIGRWAAGLAQGDPRHADIRFEPARRGEACLGLATHYATGVALTQAFLRLPRRGRPRPSLRSGLAFGIATAALPLLVMFPSMGYGPFGLRTGDAARLARIMLVGHLGFGIGIGVWAPRLPGASESRGEVAVPSPTMEPDR
jgi:hypothetical protein